MSLDLLQRRRYARQILLAEIGKQGQERLCAQPIGTFQGDPCATDVAERYLRRAGLEQGRGPTVELRTPLEVERIAGRPELQVAAAYLVGAFSAVETIKSTLGHKPPTDIPATLCLIPDDSKR